MVQKNGIFLSIVIIFEGGKLANFGSFASKRRMRIQSHFFSEDFVIVFNWLFENNECLELISKGSKEGVNLINALLRVVLVFPKDGGLKNGDDFYILRKLPFFYSTFFFINYNYYREGREIYGWAKWII